MSNERGAGDPAARPDAGAVLAVGRGQDDPVAAAAGQRQADPAQRLVHHARPAARREGRRRLSLRRHGDLPRHDRSRRVPRACAGVRPLLRHAARAGRGRR